MQQPLIERSKDTGELRVAVTDARARKDRRIAWNGLLMSGLREEEKRVRQSLSPGLGKIGGSHETGS